MEPIGFPRVGSYQHKVIPWNLDKAQNFAVKPEIVLPGPWWLPTPRPGFSGLALEKVGC